jgi:multidrug/hemolysin transport system ATP-binding protein
MGLSIFVTTHYMEEAARADYITIINKGRIVAKGTPSELKEAHSNDFIKIAPKDRASLTAYLQSQGLHHTVEGELFIVPIESTMAAVDVIDAQRNNMLRFEVLMGTLDDVFINITKRERDEC